MFEELIEKYGLTGARPEFYSAWTGQFDADFSGWLSRMLCFLRRQPPAARRRMSAVFRSASADHVKIFHRTARSNALRPAVPQIIRRRFC